MLSALAPAVRRLHLLAPHSARARAPEEVQALARSVGLSPSRLMHVFTESIGIPLRPYLSWLRVQRAAMAIVNGSPLGDAAHTAGFADASHMTRTFKRMLGAAPSVLRPMSCSPRLSNRVLGREGTSGAPSEPGPRGPPWT